MQLASQQKLITQNMVVFSLENTNEESDMIIGGDEPALRKGDYNWNPVINKSYWMIAVDSIKVGSNVIATNVKGIVDTGTSLMVGGDKTAGEILKSVSVKQDCSTDVSTLPNVTFTLLGKD